jgi:uncharacterized protein DUF222
MEQQQADALALLAETALHHGLDPGAPGERYQVVVHVDAEVLADPDAPGQSVLEEGGRVPAGTSQRLACDASRVVMRHDADRCVVEILQVDRQPDGELRFRRPDGRLLPEVPPPPQVPADPVKILRARHETEGSTCTRGPRSQVGWGSPLDVGWAIDVLHPLRGD